jgi:hypothetical protein
MIAADQPNLEMEIEMDRLVQERDIDGILRYMLQRVFGDEAEEKGGA